MTVGFWLSIFRTCYYTFLCFFFHFFFLSLQQLPREAVTNCTLGLVSAKKQKKRKERNKKRQKERKITWHMYMNIHFHFNCDQNAPSFKHHDHREYKKILHECLLLPPPAAASSSSSPRTHKICSGNRDRTPPKHGASQRTAFNFLRR